MGGPLGPVEKEWTLVTEIPLDVQDIAAGEGNVIWAVGYNRSKARGMIIGWDGAELEEGYITENSSSDLFGISFAGSTGWAAGLDYSTSPSKPLLIRYADGEWRRIHNVPIASEGFYSISAVAQDAFWVTDDENAFFYEKGNWYGPYPYPVSGVTGIAGRANSITFAWTVGGDIWVLDGRTWVKETPALPKGYGVFGINGGVVTETDIFIIAVIHSGPAEYFAIIKRGLAPAGAGSYTLPFFAPHGPYTTYLNCVAFSEAGCGLALGYASQVIFNAETYRVAPLPPAFGIPKHLAAAEDRRFWFVSSYEGGDYLYRSE
jgi:hypothetical protein